MIDIVCVIEPDINQLLGASIQLLSLRSHPGPVAYHLVVVGRSRSVAARMARWAVGLGIKSEFCPPRSENPYFNRWLYLDAFDHLRASPHVVVLDWDVVYVPDRPLPSPVDGLVCGRLNPRGMYRDRLDGLGGTLPPAVLGDDGGLATSVNSGVLLASGVGLARVAEKVVEWEARLPRFLPDHEPWMREQLVTSVAAGDVGLAPLEDRWNVTPLSPVDDATLSLWHYNDGLDATHRLKRNLVRPAVVKECCDALRGRWPRTVDRFEALHAEASRAMPFHAFLH